MGIPKPFFKSTSSTPRCGPPVPPPASSIIIPPRKHKKFIKVNHSALPVFLRQQPGGGPDEPVGRDGLTLPEILAQTEKQVIMNTLETYDYNQSRTAKALGISESGLRYKIQSLKISRE